MTLHFVRTRHHYMQYDDLYRLVDLAGLSTVYMDELDAASDATYIIPIINGEVYDGWPDARARIIHWNFEWFEYPDTPGIREKWAIDKFWAEKTGARYVPLGGDARLRPVDDGDFRDWFDAGYDAAYYGYMVHRREWVRRGLEALGVVCSPTSVWGQALNDTLNNSRVYVHVHQRDDAFTVPWLRLVRAAAYRLPVISETLADSGILGYTDLMQCQWQHIPEFVRLHLRDWRLLGNYASALHQKVCHEHTFSRVLMENL